MEVIKPNPILQFNENHLQNVRKALGYEDVNRLKQDIEQLKDWINKQNHFRIKEFDDEFLERLLIYNKGSIERTKQKFDRLCTCTNLMPEFLQNFDIRNEFRGVHIVSNNFVLPKPTDDNYRVLISHVTGDEDEEVQLIYFYRYLILMGHYMLCHDYCHGFEWVADTRQITMGIIKKANLIVIHKAMTLMVDTMGLRMKHIHLLGSSKLLNIVVTIFKQGVSAKLKDRFVIHQNLESLHEYIPREQLPKELGGDEKSAKELSDLAFKEFSCEKNMEKVKFIEKIGTDESYRLSCKFNEEYSGMPGSFKMLCLD